MAISSRKILLAFALFLMHGHSFASSCSAFSSHFIIANWNDGLPVSVKLLTYKNDGSFLHEDEAPIQYRATLLSSDIVKSALLIEPSDSAIGHLPLDHDYLIDINDNIQYKLSIIKSSDRPSLACSIESAVINSCKFNGGNRISFNMDCR